MTSRTRLASGPRRPLGSLERILVLLDYHWLLFLRTLRGVVFSRFVLPVMLLASMGLGVGSLVDSGSGGVDGVPYLSFVVPGLVMSTVMTVAVGESTYPVMGFVRWNQMYVAMLQAPLTVRDVLRAHWAMIAFSLATAAAAFTAVAALFGGVESWWAVLGVPVGVLTGLAFATPLFVIAGLTDDDSLYSLVLRLGVTPLMLFSGVFYPLSTLPVWVQPLAWVTPLWHGVELTRAAFLGGPVPGLWPVHLAVLVGYVVVGALAARWAMTRRLAS